MKRRVSKSSRPRWRITRIVGARAEELRELEAETAEAAVKRYIRENEVEPERQFRLAAYRVA
jgi:hypothetical protein